MADVFAKVTDAKVGGTAPQSHAAFDIGKEAAAVTFGTKSTLNNAEQSAYSGLLDAYKNGTLTHALKKLHSLAGGSPETVAGRFLFHLAHGHQQPVEKQAIVDTLKEFPKAANMDLNGKPMELNGKPATFVDLLKNGHTFNNFSDDKVDIAPWSNKKDMAEIQSALLPTMPNTAGKGALPSKPRPHERHL